MNSPAFVLSPVTVPAIAIKRVSGKARRHEAARDALNSLRVAMTSCHLAGATRTAALYHEAYLLTLQAFEASQAGYPHAARHDLERALNAASVADWSARALGVDREAL